MLAALHYSRLDLALAHYDARAHLVVARRVLDSLTPGWQQIGAVWLPLPHLLNMVPVQVDAWYRSGASAIAISILSVSAGVWALARLVLEKTGSRSAAIAGAFLVLGNPNVLYLQSTPMTEPLLFGTCLLAVYLTAEWVDRGAPLPPRGPGWAIVAACMTRYEAWPISAALIGLAALVLLRRGGGPLFALRAAARLAVYPLVAIVLFSANARWTTGSWFIPREFYVPDNAALGQASLAAAQVFRSALLLSGTAWIVPAGAAAAIVLFVFVRSRERASLVLVLGLAAAAVLPMYAYYEGHPVRVRYGLPLVVASAAAIAAAIGTLPRRARAAVAAAVVTWALVQSSPLDREAPLVKESQREAGERQGREAVSAYLRQHWDGTTIMMSMGSLAHYMHDLSAHGLDIRDFLQEGNEMLWVYAATQGPRGYVRWVIVEERAEGGDALYRAAQQDSRFLQGFERVAEGGGVALYEARAGSEDPAPTDSQSRSQSP
jgi:hypothetical protein